MLPLASSIEFSLGATLIETVRGVGFRLADGEEITAAFSKGDLPRRELPSRDPRPLLSGRLHGFDVQHDFHTPLHRPLLKRRDDRPVGRRKLEGGHFMRIDPS